MNAALAPNGKGYLKFQVAFWLGITPPAGSLLFGEVGLVSLTCGLQFGYCYLAKSSMSQSCLSYSELNLNQDKATSRRQYR